ncbi:MAG: hypothetical protein ACI9LG_003541, partial [Moritella dasanensis]
NQSIDKEIKQGFPHLPLGCRIELQEKTQAMVLKNISNATLNKSRLINLINNYPHITNLPLTLTNFLHINPNFTVEDIYKIKLGKCGGWSRLVAQCQSTVDSDLTDDLASAYYRAINNRLLICTSISYLRFLLNLCQNDFTMVESDQNNKQAQLFALMCHYDFWDQTGPKLEFKSLSQSLQALRHPLLQRELSDVISLLIERLDINEFDMPNMDNSTITSSPIKMHVRYPKEHILVAFGDSRFDKKSSSREGVLNISDINTELLFVTLNKCETQFSPTTMYHDYAISPSLFHWQTQNSAKPTSGKGLGYIQQPQSGKTILLFVREQAKDENGRTMGFVNFGPAEFVKYEGCQPMSITWKLTHEMPAYLWHDTAKLAVG